MKSTTSRILLAALLVAALVFGLPLLRAVRLLAYTPPGQHTFVVASFAGFVRSLPGALLPLALYAASFLLDRRMGWSRLGKLGFAVQVIYGSLFIGTSVSLYYCTHPA